MAEQRTTIQFPFSAGLNTKSDPRNSDPPQLEICRDAEFDDLGGLRTRKPYSALSTNIVGGGTIANPRKLVANGDELLLLTVDTVYSWDVAASAWSPKGTHLAVSVQEQSRFVTTDDQVDADRAELAGVVMLAWANASDVYVAAADKTTGEVRLAPTKIAAGSRPKLVATSSRILFFYVASGSLQVIAINPASISVAGATSIDNGSWGVYGGAYDIARIPSADSVAFGYRVSGSGSYTVGTLTAGLVQAQANKARTCDGPIAVSVTPDSAHVQIIRTSSANVVGDLVALPGLADTLTGEAVGTLSGAGAALQIAAAHRTVQSGGHYRCYAFWTDSGPTIGSNWVDDAGAVGVQVSGPRYTTVVSRAVDYNGRVYLWLCFAQPNATSFVGFGARLQNTYFLYRDDFFLAAKAGYLTAAGAPSSTGHLPNVSSTGGSGFAWAGGVRRIIQVAAGSSAFAQRAPRDITFAFDDNSARRAARLGSTLYIACGEGLLQYDGVQLTEAGWHVAPWNFIAASNAGGGAIGVGTYAIKCTWRWDNATGELDRSSTTNVASVTCIANDKIDFIGIQSLTVTHKTGIAVEVWRTAVNPTAEAPFYLVTSKDPNNSTNPNRYLSNDPTVASTPVFVDNEADSVATQNENNPENSGVLEAVAPPAASLAVASDVRLFLAGIAGDPDRVWYSKQRNDGEVVSFNDALTMTIPPAGGKITALAFLNETLIVFRERAIYALAGDGFDNTGGGQNYGPARVLSIEVGAVDQESVVLTEAGLVFKSSRGWFVLNRGWSTDFIGEGPADFDAELPLAANVVGGQQQVRIATSNRVLVWDSLVKQWAEWTISGVLDATVWKGTHVYLTTSGVFVQAADFSVATGYGLDVQLSVLKPSGPVGRANVRWIMPLGEVRSTCLVRLRVARNYREDGSGNPEYFDDRLKAPAAVIGGPMQVRHGPSRQGGLEGITVRITAVSATLATLTITQGGKRLVLTSKRAGTLGNVITCSSASTAAAKPSEADATNDVHVTGPATTTHQYMADAINRSSALVSAAIPDGDGVFTLSAFTGALGGGVDWPTGEGIKLSALGFEVGAQPGLFKLLAQAQKA